MKLRGVKIIWSISLILTICIVMLLTSSITSKADSVEETGVGGKDQINALLNVARNEINYVKEADGSTKYGQWYAKKVNDNEFRKASWSCMFVAWCGNQAGISEQDFGFYAYTGYWISWLKNNNAYHDATGYNAKKGDIIFIDNDNNGSVDSTGIVEKNVFGTVTVIKGNVNETVARVKYKANDNRIVGYGTPKYGNSNGEAVRLTEPKRGIDVSEFNGTVDWDRVKAAGVEFAFVRFGYRGYGAAGRFCKDKMFDINMKEANRVGIDAGVYFVTQAINEAEAIEEADYVIDQLGNYKVTYPIVIDTEKADDNERTKDLTVEERTSIIKAFCDRVEDRGYKSQIYSGKYWFNSKLDMSQLEGYDIWVAEYTHNENGQTSFEHEYSIWQYTDKGVVDGINGKVDMNNCYVDYNNTNEKGGFLDNIKNLFN